MLFTLTADASPACPDATDVGLLLHKHPDRVQTFDVSAGTATVFYPVADASTCTVAMIVEVDALALTQSRFRRDSGVLGGYVGDRPYAASSMLAVALSKVFRSAVAGTCASRPELVDAPLTLTITVPTTPSRGGADLARRLFEPLGWSVDARPIALDPTIPAWGDSEYVDLTLRGELPVRDALRHLYVLLPVLDDTKHYWVGEDEADKLVRLAGEWLATHPETDLISARYLAHRCELVASVTDRLVPDAPEPSSAGRVERPLAQRRRSAVVDALISRGVHRVVDVGCGEGRLLKELQARREFTSITGTDVSATELARAERRLGLADMSDRERARVSLMLSSATYRDTRLAETDAVVLMEVIEHVDLPRLPTLVQTVWGDANPSVVVVTTPNADFNVRYDGLAPGAFRHPDHRFEFTRAEFESWAQSVCTDYGYTVTQEFVGDHDDRLGGPTVMAIFERMEVSA